MNPEAVQPPTKEEILETMKAHRWGADKKMDDSLLELLFEASKKKKRGRPKKIVDAAAKK